MIYPNETVMVTHPNEIDKEKGIKEGDIITVKRSHERLRRIYFDHDTEGEWWLTFDQVKTLRTPLENPEISQTSKNVLHLISDSELTMSLTVNLKIGDTLHVMSFKEAKNLKNLLEALN